MPLTPIKFTPGINSVQTPTLLQSGWVSGENIRFFQGLPQKDGGFVNFTTVTDIPKSLRAWRALSGNYYLGISGDQLINIFWSGQVYDVTPLTIADQVPLSIGTIAGNSTVSVIDTVNSPSIGQAVRIIAPVSVGGIVLQGTYIITGTTVGIYNIVSAQNAVISQPNGGSARQFMTKAGSPIVTVILPNHGLSTGQIANVPVSVAIGGLTLVNNYIITYVNADEYTINAGMNATSAQTLTENGGNLRVIFFNPASGGAVNPIPALTTTSDNWGEFLLECSQGGPINVWMPASGVTTRATVVSTAPLINNYIFVSIQQQQLIALGTVNSATDLFDAMLVAWSDIGDYTDFTPTVANAAGSFRLAIGSQITAGTAIIGQNLIWTDIALYSMQFIGQPLIYGFQPLGVNCGSVGPHAVGILANTVYWMSQNQFFVLGASGPQMIDCPVWDQVFPNLDRANVQNVTCETDAFYGEVAWSVPQLGGGYMFVRLNPDASVGPAWTVSNYHHHTAWLDQNVFGAPLGGHETGLIDQHDSGVDAAGAALPTSLISGMVLISEGSQATFMRDFLPDIDWLGTTGTLTLYVYFYSYPESTPRISGPFTITPSTTVVHPRGRARAVQFHFSGNDVGSNWRLGDCRFRGQPDGSR
jgi:hypothetical protein